MRLRTIIRVVGYALAGLVFLGTGLTVLTALRAGEPSYGRNVYGLPLNTYGSAVVLLIALAVGMVWLVQRAMRRRNKR